VLILRRRVGDAVLIGDDIEIEVVEISHSRVTIGFKAPPERRILRKEVLLTRDQNLAAARGISGGALQTLLERLRRQA
jgi:carbon storage regulator